MRSVLSGTEGEVMLSDIDVVLLWILNRAEMVYP